MIDTDAGKDLRNHLLEDWKTAHNIWAHIRAYGDANWAGGGTFLSLTDTPDSYTGQSLKGVRVNSGETALEFYTVGGGSNHEILSSTHTDSTAGTVARGDLITGQGSTPKWTRLAKGSSGTFLKSDGTDLSWDTVPGGSFLSLTDTPDSYDGAYKLVRINGSNNALEFSYIHYSYQDAGWNNPVLMDCYSATTSHYAYILARRATGTYASPADAAASSYAAAFSAQARVNGVYQYVGYIAYYINAVGATYPTGSLYLGVADGAGNVQTPIIVAPTVISVTQKIESDSYFQASSTVKNVISYASTPDRGVIGTIANYPLAFWVNTVEVARIGTDYVTSFNYDVQLVNAKMLKSKRTGGTASDLIGMWSDDLIYIGAASDAIVFRTYVGGGATEVARFDVWRNFLLGGTSTATSANKVFHLFTGTAPSASITDGVLFYSADFAAGNAVPSFRTENGTVIQLNQNLTTTADVTHASVTANGLIKAVSTAAAHFEGFSIHKNAAWSTYQNYMSWRDSSNITGGFGQDFSGTTCRFVWHSIYNNAYKGPTDITMILWPDHLTLYGYSEIYADAATSFRAYTYNAGASIYSSFQTYRARGSQASPANLSVGDLTGALIFNGRVNGAFANCGGWVGLLDNVISNNPTGAIRAYLPDQGTEYLAAEIRYDRSFFRGYLLLTETSAPGTPASGYGAIVLQTDGKLWLINDGGVYYDLTLGAAHNLLSSTHSDTATGSAVLGDMIYANSTPAWTKLSGNTVASKRFLSQTGTGSASAAPVWDTIAQANVSGLTTSDSPQFTKLSLGESSPSDAILNVSGTIDAGATDAKGLLVESTLHTNTTQGTIGVAINPVHNAATGESIGYAYGLWIGLQSKTGTGTVDTAVGAYINSPTFGTVNRSLHVGGAAEALFNPFVTFNSYLQLAEISAPTAPSSGYARLYVKTDGKIYLLNDGSTEYDLTAGATAVPQSRTISTTSPLSGGGDLSTNRTFSIGGLSSLGTGNYVVGVNSGATAWEYKQLIQGSANRVTISHGAGSVTFSAPQDIHTTATPQFERMGLGAAASTTYGLTIQTTTSGSAFGLSVATHHDPSAAAQTIKGIISQITVDATTYGIATVYGLQVDAVQKAGANSVTTCIGLYLSEQTIGSANYALWVNGGTSYFNGAVTFSASAQATFNAQAQFELALYQKEISTPANPSSGYGKLYPKSGGRIYYLNSSGTEYDLTGGSEVPTSRTISTTTPLAGGGDLTTNRTLTVGGLSAWGTANYILGMNSGATAWEYKQLIQTANRVTVTHGANSITLSGPQDIHTSATPQFSRLGLGAASTLMNGILMSGTVGDGSAGCYGIQFSSLVLYPVTASLAYGIQAGFDVNTGASAAITVVRGISVPALTKSGTGSITTLYGIYIAEQTVGSTNWSLYVNAGLSYFGAGVRFASYAELAEISAPTTPGSGYGRLYVKTDGKIYFLNDGATEYDLTLGGGAPAAHNFLDSTVHNNTLTGTPVLGDLIHGNSTPAWAKLAGNTTTTKKFLSQTGTGSASAVPVWDTILQANVSGLTTTSTPQFAGLSLGEAWETDSIVNVSGTLNGGAEDINAIAVEATLDPTSNYGAMGIVVNPVMATGTSDVISYAYGIWIGQMSSTGTGSITSAVSLYVNSPSIGTSKQSLYVGGTALASFNPAVRMASYLELAEIAAPSTPSSGYARLYAKSDNKPYWLDDTGTETCLISGSGGGKSKSQEFTSDGTWTQPTGVTLVWVTGTGGGGGGEAGITSTRGGGGGGTGEYWYRYPITVSGNVTVTLGTAGTAGTGSSGANGGNGGSTTFGALLTMLGGGGGGINGSGYGGNGGGALGPTGAISAGSAPTGKGGHYFPGASGGGGTAGTGTGYAGGTVMRNSGGSGGNSTYGGGGGGSTFYGTGGTGGTSGVAGGTPTSTYYGCGGGGGWGGASYTNGGAGIKGYLLVEWIE